VNTIDRSREHRLFQALFLGLLLFHVVLISQQRLFPFIDLPFHLASASIIKNYNETGNVFQDYYQIDMSLQANVFHLGFCLNPLFPSVEAANKAFYILYVCFLPLAVLFAIQAAGGTLWFSLLSFLLLYNNNVIWGFTGFSIGIPTFFLLIGLLLKSGRKPTPALLVSMALVFILLFFMHAVIALVAMMFFMIWVVLLTKPDVPGLMTRCLAVVPTCGLFIVWWAGLPLSSYQTLETLMKYYRAEFWTTFRARELLLYADYSSLFAGPAGKVAGFMVVSLIGGLLLIGLCRGVDRSNCVRSGQKFRVVLLATSFFMVLALVSPYDIRELCWYFYPRFAVFVLLLLIILGSMVWRGRMNRFMIVLICCAAMVSSGLWWDYFRSFDRENDEFRSEFLPRDKTARMAGTMYDFRYRGRPHYIHFPNYQIIWNNGIATTRLIDYSLKAVHRTTDFKVLPLYHEWITADNPYDGRYSHLEYILVRGSIPRGDLTHFSDFSCVARSDKWSLYHHRHSALPATHESTAHKGIINNPQGVNHGLSERDVRSQQRGNLATIE